MSLFIVRRVSTVMIHELPPDDLGFEVGEATSLEGAMNAADGHAVRSGNPLPLGWQPVVGADQHRSQPHGGWIYTITRR